MEEQTLSATIPGVLSQVSNNLGMQSQNALSSAIPSLVGQFGPQIREAIGFPRRRLLPQVREGDTSQLVALVEERASQLSLSGEVVAAASRASLGFFERLGFRMSTRQGEAVLVRQRFGMDVGGIKSPSVSHVPSLCRATLEDLAGPKLERASSAA